MGKLGAYEPIDQYKNYSLPTSKPLRSHPFYQEKVWTLQDQIYKKLKKIAELLESLYPKLTDDFNQNTKNVIEKNLKTVIEDLDLLQQGFHKNKYTFNTKKLKTNQQCITEMKNACDTLQTVRAYEYEFRNLGKIKHALTELEHLIQPTSFERNLEKTQAKSKPKAVPAKKRPILVKAKKKIKEESIAKSKKQKVILKKAKPVTKLPKQKKIASKQPKKTETPVRKIKQAAKKVTKSKPKLTAKNTLKAKPASKLKSSAKHKKKVSH